MADTLGRPTTEHRLETPLTLVNVVRRRDDVLELVLHVVNVLDDGLVRVIERDGDYDVPLDVFKPSVCFDVFLHRLANATGPRIEPFGLPRVVEFLEKVVGDIEASAHGILI